VKRLVAALALASCQFDVSADAFPDVAVVSERSEDVTIFFADP
jgi:hypothetical protein